MLTPARGFARKTHCRRGHAYDEGNTYIMKNGYRQCRACKQVLKGIYRARRGALKIGASASA